MFKVLDITSRNVLIKMDKSLFEKVAASWSEMKSTIEISPKKASVLRQARSSAAKAKKSFTSAKSLIDDILNS